MIFKKLFDKIYLIIQHREVIITTKDELYDLLDELSLPDSIISRLDTPKWYLWRRKDQIREDEVFLLLREYVEQRTKQADTKARENTYSVFAMRLLRTFEPEHCQFLIDRLRLETNKYVLHTMLSGISCLQLPEGIDVSPIVECSKNDEWMVRHTAIMALAKSSTDAGREAVRYWVNQKDEKQYKFELIYANAALGYIGEPGDIVMLEQHVRSRIPDVKDSAIYAIDNIKKRFEKNFHTSK